MKARSYIPLAVALSCFAPSLASPARADPPPAKGDKAPSPALDDTDKQAAAHLAAGNKAFREGRFADAERAYREAFALKKGYDIAGNLGAAEQAQGKLKQAAQHYAFTLKSFPITGEPEARERIKKALDQCRQGVGAVAVKGAPKGAVIHVDGAPVGEAPLDDDLFVDPGEHTLLVSLEGYKSASRKISLEKAERIELNMPLERLPPPDKAPPPKPSPKRSLIPIIGLSAGAAVALAVGAGVVVLGGKQRDDVVALREVMLADKKSCVEGAANFDEPRCAELRRRAEKSDFTRSTGEVILVVGGAALLGLGAYLILPLFSSDSPTTFKVKPQIGLNAGGLSVSGVF